MNLMPFKCKTDEDKKCKYECDYKNLCIREDSHKWDAYERPIQPVLDQCDDMRNGGV